MISLIVANERFCGTCGELFPNLCQYCGPIESVAHVLPVLLDGSVALSEGQLDPGE